MDDKTLEALIGSIKKWEGIVGGTHRDHGADDCPLCRVFYDARRGCEGCPVAAKVWASYCANTPYATFRRDGTREAAVAELDFLRSLLPQLKWGFDTTLFSANGWYNLMGEFGFRFYDRVVGHLNEFEWRSFDSKGYFDDHFKIWTTNNPNTGEYYQPEQRDPQPGFAGFIGIEGRYDYIRPLVETIRQRAEFIKDESPRKRGFI